MSSFLAIPMFTVAFLAPIVVLARVVVVRLVARCGQVMVRSDDQPFVLLVVNPVMTFARRVRARIEVAGHPVLPRTFAFARDAIMRGGTRAAIGDQAMSGAVGWNRRRVHRLLARRGVLDDLGEGSTADPWREEAPVLAGIAGASVQGRRALGDRAGAAVRRCGASAELLALAPSGRGPCHARGNGFDLHAAVVVPPRDRARLERLCRYALRPPIATDRLHLTADGQVVLDLRHRWANGTTQLLFEPVELLERLAALTPRPRINLLLYYGVLGARSAWRSRLQAREPETAIAGGRGRLPGSRHRAPPRLSRRARTRRSGEVCPPRARPTRSFDRCVRRRDDPRRACGQSAPCVVQSALCRREDGAAEGAFRQPSARKLR